MQPERQNITGNQKLLATLVLILSIVCALLSLGGGIFTLLYRAFPAAGFWFMPLLERVRNLGLPGNVASIILGVFLLARKNPFKKRVVAGIIVSAVSIAVVVILFVISISLFGFFLWRYHMG